MSGPLNFAAMEQRIEACNSSLQMETAPERKLRAAQELTAAVTEYVRMLQRAFPEHYEQWLRSVS